MPYFRAAFSGLLLFLAAQHLVAQPYYVGGCKTEAFPTISAAVAAVPAGSTVAVCPGYYAEQVVINKPLTLHGLRMNDSSLVRIAMPAGGLITTTSIVYGTVAAQVEVTAGPVNIKNIQVDGFTVSNCPTSSHIGVFYGSGTSGTMSGVSTSSQNCNDQGIGILVENGGTTDTVTISNSNIQTFTKLGIQVFCACDQNSGLTASVKGNYVSSPAEIALAGIEMEKVAGSVSGNLVSVGHSTVAIAADCGSFGAPDCGSHFSVTGNTLSGWEGVFMLRAGSVTYNTLMGTATIPMQFGIVLFGTANTIVKHNNVSFTNYGIWLSELGVVKAVVQSNIITNSSVGIELNCSAARLTVSANTINAAEYGLDAVPRAFTGANNFYNVGRNRNGGCLN